MRNWALAILLLLPLPAAAQDALVVDCREGTVMLENHYVPQTAVGPQGEKVLPMHMLLNKTGTFTFEFRSEQPFTLYAYRYDVQRRGWEFLPMSNVSQPGSEGGGIPYNGWQGTVTKVQPAAEDYLFQAMPQASGQAAQHRFVHIRRTTGCAPG